MVCRVVSVRFLVALVCHPQRLQSTCLQWGWYHLLLMIQRQSTCKYQVTSQSLSFFQSQLLIFPYHFSWNLSCIARASPLYRVTPEIRAFLISSQLAKVSVLQMHRLPNNDAKSSSATYSNTPSWGSKINPPLSPISRSFLDLKASAIVGLQGINNPRFVAL